MAAAFDLAVVGSGFAGSLLARLAARQGLSVLLVERGRHPRFALGESSTPLANLALERMARRFGEPDLHHLAAWGRWNARFPELRHGLKRGFTFYRHSAGRPYANSAANEARLLVAASPGDACADSHWLRADVDHHFVRMAVGAGVEYWDETRLEGLEEAGEGLRLAGRRQGRPVAATAGRVVDGSGRDGFLASVLALPERPPAVETSLLFAHLAGLPSFVELAREGGARLDPGPYPDERAAVHHLLEEGWAYVLPFDHGVASCGLVLRRERLREEAGTSAAAAAEAVLARYPPLARQLAAGRQLEPWRHLARLPYRRTRAAGERWLLLPHAYAFSDPLFSTGIAWSLLAVERLLDVVTGRAEAARYAARLEREADRIEALVAAAWRAMPDFRRFAAVSWLYFAAVSWAEVRQRLEERDDWAWEGFLGSGDDVLDAVVAELPERLEAVETARLESWMRQAIAPRNLAGLGDPARHNLYPLDLDLLLDRAPLLGLTRGELAAALPRLRGLASS